MDEAVQHWQQRLQSACDGSWIVHIPAPRPLGLSAAGSSLSSRLPACALAPSVAGRPRQIDLTTWVLVAWNGRKRKGLWCNLALACCSCELAAQVCIEAGQTEEAHCIATVCKGEAIIAHERAM